ADEDESGIPILLRLFEASLGIGDRDTARVLTRRLAPLAGRVRLDCHLSIGRLLGDAARLLDQPDEARRYYQQALEICERVRFRPEVALIRLGLAELLLEPALTPTLSQREREEAQGHLDF